jgi:Putative metal-binding motif/FG-GAP repeat
MSVSLLPRLPWLALVALWCPACLIDEPLYLERLAYLTDNDSDGVSEQQGDCDDADASVNPTATEQCNGFDDDCDAQVDEAPAGETWFNDSDGDGAGDPDASSVACDAPAGAVANADDCDDSDGAVYSGAVEVCNEVDDDCDDEIDEGVGATIWYVDLDGDGFGDPDGAEERCEGGDGWAANGDDCDDGDAGAWPGAPEVLDGVDQDCDGRVDVLAAEALGARWTAAVAHGRAGAALAMGDFDEDGTPDLAVGAPGDETYTDNLPGVYLVWSDPSSGGELDGADLVLRDETDPDSLFGSSLAIAGSSLAIGAPLADVDGVTRGAVYLLDAADAALGWEGVRVVSDTSPGNSQLGEVRNAGDWDGDGVLDLLVGNKARQADGLTVAGVVFVIPANTPEGEVGDAAMLVVNGVEAAAHLGKTLAGGVDVDGDGYPDALLAAPESGGGSHLGSVYLIGGGQVGTLAATDCEASFLGEHEGAEAGASVALIDDLDGDGRAELLIGQKGGDDTWLGGRVNLLQGRQSGSPSLEAAEARFNSMEAGANIGGWLGQSDGSSSLVPIGNPETTGAGEEAGGIHLGDASLGGTITISRDEAFLYGVAGVDTLGWSSILAEGLLVVGMPGHEGKVDGGGGVVALDIEARR